MTSRLEDLLAFMEIKYPAILEQSKHLAFAFLWFLVPGILTLLLLYDAIPQDLVAFPKAGDVDILAMGIVVQSKSIRTVLLAGFSAVCLATFIRFGYLYFQTVYDAHLTSKILDDWKQSVSSSQFNQQVAESLGAASRSNFIVQSLLVFKDDFLASGGASKFGLRTIQLANIVLIILAGWFIAVCQFSLLIVTFSTFHYVICLLLVLIFIAYYGFFFVLFFRVVDPPSISTGRRKIAWLAILVAGIVALSSTISNVQLLFAGTSDLKAYEKRVEWCDLSQKRLAGRLLLHPFYVFPARRQGKVLSPLEYVTTCLGY